MTEVFKDNKQIIVCDTCGKEYVLYDGSDKPGVQYPSLPMDWWFIAFGHGRHTENADEAKHYCSKECRDQWVLSRIVRLGSTVNLGNTTFPVAMSGVAYVIQPDPHKWYRQGT